MESRSGFKCSWRNMLQHYILNWIVVSRYRMVHNGMPKEATQRYLQRLESLLRKMNILA